MRVCAIAMVSRPGVDLPVLAAQRFSDVGAVTTSSTIFDHTGSALLVSHARR